MNESIEELKRLHLLAKPELKQALINIDNILKAKDGAKALFTLYHLATAITSFDHVGDILFAEIDSLKEKLNAKITLINNGWEEERYALQESEMELRKQLESQKEEVADLKMQSESHYNHFLGLNDEADALTKQLESLKAITELAVKGLEDIKQMLDMDHSGYQKYQIWKTAFDSLEEIKRLGAQ